MLTYEKVKEIYLKKGYKFTEKPFEINLCAFRKEKTSNKFDEIFCITYKDNMGCDFIYLLSCTTKPGIHWLKNLLNPNGAAIMMEGFYEDSFVLGLHNRSKITASYEALEQIKPIKYFRDKNKDDKHDYSGQTFVGIFKTNIHRAAESGLSTIVDKWSAGCQVISGMYNKTTTNYNLLIEKAKKQKEFSGKDTFSYALFNEKDITL